MQMSMVVPERKDELRSQAILMQANGNHWGVTP